MKITITHKGITVSVEAENDNFEDAREVIREVLDGTKTQKQ